MGMTSRPRTNPPVASLLKLAAEYRSRRGRPFLLHLRLILVPAFAAIILVGEAVVHLGWSLYDMVAVIIAYLTIGFYQQAFFRPIYTPGALRSLAEKGWGPASPQYYSELARFMEDYGAAETFRWVTTWGWAALGLFYGLLILSVGLVQTFVSILGLWSLAVFVCVAFPVSFYFWRSYRERIQRFDAAAEAQGYPLQTASRPPR